MKTLNEKNNMMIRKSILLSFCAIFSLCCWGQNNQTTEINKIKKDKNYLTVTGTSMKSSEEASQNAQIMLAAEIEEWLKENAKDDVTGYTAKAKQCIGYIQTKIGSLHRTFAYVKKTDILPYYKGDVIISNSSKTDTSVNKEHSENGDSSLNNELVSSKKSTSEKISIGANSVKDAEKIISEQNNGNTGGDNAIKESNAKKNTNVSSESKGSRAAQTEESEIVNLSTTNSVKSYLRTLLKEKKIDQYGNVSDYPRHGVAYVLLSDYHGIVRRRVRCTNGVSVDLENGSAIDLSSLISQYSVKNSIWFTFK